MGDSRFLLMTLVNSIVLLISSCSKTTPVGPSDSITHDIVCVMLDTATARSFVYRMKLDGTDVMQLTFPDEVIDSVSGALRGSASEPRWSWDGKKIAYTESLGPDESHIVIMNADGTFKKNLTPIGGYCIRPRWNPAGDHVLYLRGTWAGGIIGSSVVDTSGSTFDITIAEISKVIDGDTIFYDPTQVQWASTGMQVVIWGNVGGAPSTPVCGENGAGELFLLEVETGEVIRRLTRNNTDECGFEISPNAERILTVRGPYQTDSKIYMMSVLDGSSRAVTSGKNDNWPRWSRDGGIIVYLKDENDDAYNDPYFSNRIYYVETSLLREKRVSFLVANEPDVR